VLRALPLLLLALACKTTDVPARGGPDSAVLGVRVNVTLYQSHQLTLQPQTVYFARLPEGEDTLLQTTQLVESNYRRGALLMLLNAEPGRYAVVCAVTTWEGRSHFVFVSEKSARESIIEVKPGQYTYMGSLSMKESRSFSKADELQNRSVGLVKAKPAHPNVWQQLFPRAMEFLGEHGALSRTPGDAERTEKSMRKTLARYGW